MGVPGLGRANPGSFRCEVDAYTKGLRMAKEWGVEGGCVGWVLTLGLARCGGFYGAPAWGG